MKHFIVFLALLLTSIASTVSAATYYVANNGADTNAGNSKSAPWQTLVKINATAFRPGDNVLFQRGDTFYGSVTVHNSGTSENPIVYSAYGTGAAPIISGFTTLSNWTLLSGNIYYASLDVPSLNMVTVDDVVKAMGRYPNSGYLSYENHTENTSITDNQLTATPDWTGAEVVIRKYRWILDRQFITSQVGGTLNYNALRTYGNNNAYKPLNGNGYFIQGSLAALDTPGEWYYDKTNKRLYMYFAGRPLGKVVKASSVDRNGTVNSQSYIT
ncbi:MAG: hypothetical protein ABI210_01490, partial [Abditibacteriaceae bacterium]